MLLCYVKLNATLHKAYMTHVCAKESNWTHSLKGLKRIGNMCFAREVILCIGSDIVGPIWYIDVLLYPGNVNCRNQVLCDPRTMIRLHWSTNEPNAMCLELVSNRLSVSQ